MFAQALQSLLQSMNAIFSSFGLVAISEMGDKTQLLAFSLATRFKQPLPIIAGIFVATVANHALAAWVGVATASFLSPVMMSWILAATFIGCGFWALIPDKLEDEGTKPSAYGAFWTTTVVFFLAEMGDKTQLATIALAARFTDIIAVTIGTTLGMMATNSIAVFAGDRLAEKVQMKFIRWGASGLFFAFGAYSAFLAMQ
jgi:putative Ca2+/H+ antiporter (TMEM165/GDT1 family)